MVKSKKLTEKEIEKNIANVKASLAMEGLNVTDDESEIAKRILRGEISAEEAIKLMIKMENQ